MKTESLKTGIGRYIDHAILQTTVTDEQVRAECAAFVEYRLASICVRPDLVRLAAEVLRESNTAVGTVIGFPHGTQLTQVKAFEAEQAFEDGATEVDMVVNCGKILGGDWDFIRDDIEEVKIVTTDRQGLLKVIFETDYLRGDEVKITLCEICNELAVDFVKTSTGFGFVKGPEGNYSYRGATDHDVRLMRKHCNPGVGVKASGGIRTLKDAMRVIDLGATRIGTTATVAILEEDEQRRRYARRGQRLL